MERAGPHRPLAGGDVRGLVDGGDRGLLDRQRLPASPDGQYAMTALGCERMYEYFSQVQRTPVVLLRLNYATERRYEVLVDLAQQIAAGEPIDVTMSYVNVIWLGDTPSGPRNG